MTCCIFYHNTYSVRSSWPNHQAINFLTCGSSEIVGKSGKRDLRLWSEALAQLNRQQTVACLIATLMTFSLWFTICGFPWMLSLCSENSKLIQEVEIKLRGEGRETVHCTFCTITCCFALENKPDEIDVMFNSVITLGAGEGGDKNNNNNNNNNNIVVNNQPAASNGTSANDIMLMQQMQFNQMMQATMMANMGRGGLPPQAPIGQSFPAPIVQAQPVGDGSGFVHNPVFTQTAQPFVPPNISGQASVPVASAPQNPPTSPEPLQTVTLET
eukprot:gene16410-18616_t